MKWYLLLIFILSNFNGRYSINDTQEINTYQKLKRIINKLPTRTQSYWKYHSLPMLAFEIDSLHKKTKIPVNYLLAMIHRESRYKVYSIGKNKYTKDYGLFQNNSKYIQGRCKKILKRYCKRFEFFNPVLSVKLASVHLEYCGRLFRSVERKIECYNSPKRAFKFSNKSLVYFRLVEQRLRNLV